LDPADSWVWIEGFFVPSRGGAFLIKDVFLLGAAFVLTGEALAAGAGEVKHAPIP
jgi:uncharacterized membrane protein YkgB